MHAEEGDYQKRYTGGVKTVLVCTLFLALHSPVMAARGCSPEAEYRVGRAAECLEAKDVGCAKLKLEPILQREPRCGAALFVHGWIVQYSDGRESEGRAIQDRAIELDPELKNFWEERGHAIETGLTQQKFSNFDVQFNGAQNRDKAWQAVNYLNEMHGDLSAFFGTTPKRRIPVIVFTTGEFLEAWRAPFIGGFFDRKDGKIRIRVDEVPGGQEEFQRRARHELTHAFVHQLYSKELPEWVSEGIAEYCARHGVSQGFWKDARLEQIRKLRKGYPWMSLSQIDEAIHSKSGTLERLMLAYLESEALVIWITKDRGDSWFPRVIQKLAAGGGSFEDAYASLFGVTPAVEMERLRRYWE